MRAVGEALGLGRTFPEAFLKALEGVEVGRRAAGDPRPPSRTSPPSSSRSARPSGSSRRPATCAAAKRFGLPDARIARRARHRRSARCGRARPLPGRLAVDSCAGEFEARTPYYYLSYEAGDGDEPRDRAPIVVLGSGPNRIGQGIEFDYCCVRAAQAFRRLGYEVVLVNSNPETVSTDYDTCDRLYLEPVTLERVLDVCALEQPLGVVVALGGQTPLAARARRSRRRACRCSATRSPAIEAAEDRGRFGDAARRARPARRPRWGVAETTEEARALADELGYPGARAARTTSSAAAACASRAAPEELELDEPGARRPSSSRARSSSTSTCSATARTAGWPRSSSTSSAAGVHSGRLGVRASPRPR